MPESAGTPKGNLRGGWVQRKGNLRITPLDLVGVNSNVFYFHHIFTPIWGNDPI